jgi:AraC-like DNA-binding protein
MSRQSLYVGPDWIMYAGPDGYEHSEMLSPAILLGAPGEPLACRFGSSELSSSCLLHPAGVWSAVSASPLIVIYLDPMSRAGRTIQCTTGTPKGSAQILEGLQDYPTDFEKIRSAAFSPREASMFVDTLRAGIESIGDRRTEDDRIRLVAGLLSADPVGRLNLKQLASTAGLSAEHLRHLFKQQTGITLSKYKTWRQLHVMFCQVVSTKGPVYDWDTHETLQSAGFYDDSHGYRTISQYFGPQRTMADKELRLINCLG